MEAQRSFISADSPLWLGTSCRKPNECQTAKINYVLGLELTVAGLNSLAAINIVPRGIQP